MGLPSGRSLNGATGVTSGDVVDYREFRGLHTAVAVLTGSPSSYSVSVYGSLDGANWYSFGSISSGNPGTLHVTSKVARYVRADVTALSGGTSPTVTVDIAGA